MRTATHLATVLVLLSHVAMGDWPQFRGPNSAEKAKGPSPSIEFGPGKKGLWRAPQEEAFTGEMACTACPIVARDRLIVHAARSIQAFDIATGRRIWVAKCNTTATSTPVIAGGKIYTVAGDGHISVLTLGPEPEILTVNDMQDGVYATPAVVDGTIYIRTHSALFAFGKE